MRPVMRNAVTITVVVIVGVAGFVGGWYAKGSSGGFGSTTNLGIIAAGSLNPNALLPSLASEYANLTHGISAPSATQLYEGSAAAATAIVTAGSASIYDVFISADYRVIPQDLVNVHPSYATGEAVFASDPLVLAYNPSALSGVTSANWYQKITGPGIVLGTPNASADPLGANVIITFELEDALENQSGALYDHFFTGTQGGLAGITSSTRYVVESSAALALRTDEVQAYLIYASYAKADALSYVTLDPLVNLGGVSSSDVANYGSAQTTLLSGTSTKVVVGAPALFALTVPTNAPNAAVGNAFAAWLVSNATAPRWAADGFVLTPALWGYGPTAFLPPGAAELPSYLAALI
ncbi:MAG: substrate-binding domain-containing protein [Thermoplasmata archaeon]